MTDARPEPDKIEADPESEVRPEPVWARPASPDPWGRPDGPAGDQNPTGEPHSQAPEPETGMASTAAPTASEPEVAESAASQPTAPAPAHPAADQAATEQVPVDPAPSPDGAPGWNQPAPEHSSPQSSTQPEFSQPQYTQPEYLQSQYSEPQYPQPQYAQPDYPQPQYPQYVAPQGFESPRGPGGPTQSAPTGAGPLLPGQAMPGQPGSGQPHLPGSADRSGADPAAEPSAPWYVDATQPTQQFDGTNWSQPSGYPVGGAGARKKGRGALIALLVGLSLLVGALGGVAGSALRDGVTDSSGRNPTISLPAPAPVDANRPASQVTTIAAAILPSVVSINVEAGEQAGTGSGFVIDADKGYILTNNHVVTAGGTAAATSIEVVFQDGTEVPGKVVGLDASYDLAVVKVAAKGLRQLQLGNSDSVRVGDPVIAVGAPLGLQGTVTTGIVSALNRPVAAGEGNKPAFINAIQTDAAINPGNSGGPLVDASGNVIAVNSAIARSPGALGSSSGNIGLGFAIPSNQARRTAEQLIRTGKASHPIIGVSLDSAYTGRGVKVSDQTSANGANPVTANGPADKAGIKAGDVILKINGRPVTAPDELIVAIRAQTPGNTITLTVLRGKTEKQVRVKLSEATD